MIKNTHQIFRNYSAEKMGNLRLPNFSLKKIKNEIIKISYNVSTSTSGSITQLKNNLK